MMKRDEKTPIDEAIDAVEARQRSEAELAELAQLGEEARRTFPDGWKLRLFDTPGGVAVSIEFIVATMPTAADALRKAIDDYKAAAAADPANAERVTIPARIYGADGKPLA